MTPRGRFIAYLACVHVALAGAGIALLLNNPVWLFVVEGALAASLLAGIVLTRAMYRHLRLAGDAARLLQEHDFTSRLRPVGQPEVDELIAVYNRMVDSVRTERTRLQEQHHFLTDVLRVSPSGVVVLDYDGRIATVNPAAERLLGAPASALGGVPLQQLESPLGRALSALAPASTTLVAIGSARRVRCHHGRFIDRGFPRGFLLIEELTEELRDAERGAYEKLIRVMAHEVNNSVAASNSLLHSCLTFGNELSAASRADFDTALRVVIARTDELNRFMGSLANVFRLPAPVRRPAPIVPLLEHCARLAGARPDAAGVEWVWDVEDPHLTVPLDRGQMEQALLNVMQNAIEAIDGRGIVTIRVGATRGARPTVIIEDSGPGLDLDMLANLFTPFYSTKPRGQGIGLTLVREILAGHGFACSLEHPPGGPTRFTLVF